MPLTATTDDKTQGGLPPAVKSWVAAHSDMSEVIDVAERFGKANPDLKQALYKYIEQG